MIKSKKMKLMVVLACALLLVLLSLSEVCSATVTRSKMLPPAVESYLQYQSSLAGLTSSEINEMRTLWIDRLAENKVALNSVNKNQMPLAPSNKFAANDFGTLSLTNYQGYLFQFSHVEYMNGGQVYDALNSFGQADGSFARIWTPEPNSTGAIAGEMSSTNCGGAIYVQAKLGPYGEQYQGNYLMVEVNDNDMNDPIEEWIEGFVGYVQISSTEELNYYVGIAPFDFKYLAIGCAAMGGDCLANDIMVDAVGSTVGNSPATITLYSSDGGHAVVSDSLGNYLGGPGSYLVTRGDYARVDAYPYSTYEFDHWHLDGNDAGNNNPYLVMMNADHTVQPTFDAAESTQIVAQAIRVVGGWYYYVPRNVWVDGNFIGTTETSLSVTPGYHTVTFEGAPSYLLVNGVQHYNGQSIQFTTQSPTWYVIAVYLG